MECYISPNLFWWRNKLIYILDALWESTLSAIFHFWVNYSFDGYSQLNVDLMHIAHIISSTLQFTQQKNACTQKHWLINCNFWVKKTKPKTRANSKHFLMYVNIYWTPSTILHELYFRRQQDVAAYILDNLSSWIRARVIVFQLIIFKV